MGGFLSGHTLLDIIGSKKKDLRFASYSIGFVQVICYSGKEVEMGIAL